jgi:23S rRNA pseudouridine1911/1915/1917 synthase
VSSLVLGEDARRLYFWKPAGIPVFPPHADPAGDCLLARVLTVYPDRADGFPPGFEAGIAHRLDTATSGLVIAARMPTDLEPLRTEFSERRLRKHYLFRSDDTISFDRVVTVALAHHPKRKDRMVWERGARTAHRGRWYPAWTRLVALGGGWWRAEIRTGVTHQVRAHAACAGIPLDGDPIYGGAPRPFVLHHAGVVGPGWVSPVAPLPEGIGGPDVVVRPESW